MEKLLIGIIVFILALVATVMLGMFIEVFWGTFMMPPLVIAAVIVILFIYFISKL